MASSAVFAEQKIGVVNLQQITQSMPQAAGLREKILAEFKDQIEEVSRLEKDIKYYQEKNQRDAATMNAKQKEELEKKINTLGQEYTGKAQALNQNMKTRGQEEESKLLGLIKQGIDTVAAKEKFDIILNSNAIIFTNPENDISKLVIDQVAKIN